jgi:hypothetical protein
MTNDARTEPIDFTARLKQQANPVQAPARRIVRGSMTMIGAVLVAVAGAVVLALIANGMQRDPDIFREVSPVFRWVISNRGLVIFLAVPAFICGLLLAIKLCTRAQALLLSTIGSLCNAVLVVVIIWCFISYLAPMYQSHPL